MKNLSSIIKNLTVTTVIAAAFTIASGAQAEVKQGKAEVKKVRGDAQYSTGGNVWVPLKEGTMLKAGSVVKTSADSTVDLNMGVNGPVVRVTPSTTVAFDKLSYTETGADTVIETQLNVQSGRVMGNVKKLAAASRYEVKMPTGVAGVRGTDYDVEAKPLGDGKFASRVTSITGTMIASVMMGGNAVTGVLNSGETWTPEGGVQKLSPEALIALKDQIAEAIRNALGTRTPAALPPELLVFVPATLGAQEPAPSPSQPANF